VSRIFYLGSPSIHSSIAPDPIRSAIVWGASAKHSRGQKVGLDHVLEDEDGMSSSLNHKLCSMSALQSCIYQRNSLLVVLVLKQGMITSITVNYTRRENYCMLSRS
jgi:hypothetical protein